MENILQLIQTLGKHLGAEITMRQLAKEASIPYTSAVRAIKEHKNLFRINPQGNLKLLSLNLTDPIVKNYLVIGEREAAETFFKKQPLFKLLRNDLPPGDYALLLFGSRAEGTQRDKSDVDLCIINKNGERTIRFSKLELLFKLEINPLFF